MTETRTVHDPFLGKDVEISNRLVDRLRGRYAVGPTLPNGEPEFGWRQHDGLPPIHGEAADEIERLRSLHPVRLQARKNDSKGWYDIFPAQLGFVVANGFEVQAIEEKDPSYEAELQRIHNEKCAAFERAIVAEAKLADALKQLEYAKATTDFCEWLTGYFMGVTGRDELTAFEANSIRNRLSQAFPREGALTDEKQREYEPGMNPIDDAEFGMKP